MNFNILSNKIYASIFAIICTLLWGSAFPSIKLGYKEFQIENNDIKNILLFAGIRFFFASGLIILIENVWEKRWIYPSANEVFPIIFIGIINTFLQYFFFYIGLVNTSGTKGSVLNSSVTFFTLILAHFLFREDQLTIKKIIGCLFGIMGVMVINLNFSKPNKKNENYKSDNDNLSFNFQGDGMILLSSLCSALGTVLIKIFNSNNSNELFHNYKNWKIIKYIMNISLWFVDKLKRGSIFLMNKLFTNSMDDKEEEIKKSIQKNKNDNSYEEEIHESTLYDNQSIDSYKEKKYHTSLDKIDHKNLNLNKDSLRNSNNSYFSNNLYDHSSIYNNYLNNNYDETEFEDIEIVPPNNNSFHESINDFEKTKRSYENSKDYMNTTIKNKEFALNEIVDLYSYSKIKKDIIMLTGYQMLVGAVSLILTGLFWTPKISNYTIFSNKNINTSNSVNEKKAFESIRFLGFLIIIYMILITSVAFSLWNILIKYNSVGFLSFFNFLIPIFGTIFSGLFLNESIITIENGISLFLVTLGVIISN